MSVTPIPCRKRTAFPSSLCRRLSAGHAARQRGGEAADLRSVGNWSSANRSGDLVAGAGTDFASPHRERQRRRQPLNISNTGGAAWTVWAQTLRLEPSVGVTLGGAPRSTAVAMAASAGGDSYVTVSEASSRLLFTGDGDRSGIGLQLQLARGLDQSPSRVAMVRPSSIGFTDDRSYGMMFSMNRQAVCDSLAQLLARSLTPMASRQPASGWRASCHP